MCIKKERQCGAVQVLVIRILYEDSRDLLRIIYRGTWQQPNYTSHSRYLVDKLELVIS